MFSSVFPDSPLGRVLSREFRRALTSVFASLALMFVVYPFRVRVRLLEDYEAVHMLPGDVVTGSFIQTALASSASRRSSVTPPTPFPTSLSQYTRQLSAACIPVSRPSCSKIGFLQYPRFRI